MIHDWRSELSDYVSGLVSMARAETLAGGTRAKGCTRYGITQTATLTLSAGWSNVLEEQIKRRS